MDFVVQTVDFIGVVAAAKVIGVRRTGVVGGSMLQPQPQLFAGHVHAIEPVFKHVQLIQQTHRNVARRNQVANLGAAGQRRADGQLRRNRRQLRLVQQIHQRGGLQGDVLIGESAGSSAQRLIQISLQLLVVGSQRRGNLLIFHQAFLIRQETVAVFSRHRGHGLGRRVVGELHEAQAFAAAARQHGHNLALGIEDVLTVVGVMEVTIHNRVNPGGQVNHCANLVFVVRGVVAIGRNSVFHAGVRHDNHHVAALLLAQDRHEVLNRGNQIAEVDALIVGLNLPSGDVGRIHADDANLHALKFLDDVRDAHPGIPLGALCHKVGGGHGHGMLLAVVGAHHILNLTLENRQIVVELVIAQAPHVVVHQAQRLHHGIVLFRSEVGVVIGHGRALHGIAAIHQNDVLFRSTNLLDHGSDHGQTHVRRRFASGVVDGQHFAVHVAGRDDGNHDGIRILCERRAAHQGENHGQRQQKG